MLSKAIIDYISRKVGVDITTPAGATILANDIESKTGERLAANTIKRLTGIIPYQSNPRPATLEIIAHYLGYSSWEVLKETVYDHVSDFNCESPFVEVATLPVGAEISFSWEPDREISLKHLGAGRCEVVRVANSKLKTGDILSLSQLADGYPFVVRDVVRDGRSLGSYSASNTSGISNLNVE